MATPKGLVPVTPMDVAAAQEILRHLNAKGIVNTVEEANAIRQLLARHRADALTEALQVVREAREALREYACHGGPDVPCLRSAHDCAGGCGKAAGDTFVALTAFIAQHEGEEA